MFAPLSKEKRQEWQEKILQQQNSGQSISHWCRENQVSFNGFIYWKKRFIPPSPLNRSSFKELPESPHECGLTIEYRGVRIIISQTFDAVTLVRCIHALRGLSC